MRYASTLSTCDVNYMYTYNYEYVIEVVVINCFVSSVKPRVSL